MEGNWKVNQCVIEDQNAHILEANGSCDNILINFIDTKAHNAF